MTPDGDLIAHLTLTRDDAEAACMGIWDLTSGRVSAAAILWQVVPAVVFGGVCAFLLTDLPVFRAMAAVMAFLAGVYVQRTRQFIHVRSTRRRAIDRYWPLYAKLPAPLSVYLHEGQLRFFAAGYDRSYRLAAVRRSVLVRAGRVWAAEPSEGGIIWLASDAFLSAESFRQFVDVAEFARRVVPTPGHAFEVVLPTQRPENGAESKI